MLLFSVVAHEYAHGYVALRNGDPTAYQLGRLTWNPVKHIDPFLTLILPAVTFYTAGIIFGGAKPVPVNPRNYRNFKRGDIQVSLAGIATNAALVFVIALLVVAVGLIGRAAPAITDTVALLQRMLLYGILINIILAGFNLLPIPPLDGSHVAKYLLPPAWALSYERLGRYGLLILVALLTIGRPIIWPYFGFLLGLFEAARAAVGPFVLPGSL
jgi:Zn-dependent protease